MEGDVTPEAERKRHQSLSRVPDRESASPLPVDPRSCEDLEQGRRPDRWIEGSTREERSCPSLKAP